MKIKLAKKLAPILDGVDVSHVREGESVDLPRRDADMLIAEGWALRADEVRRRQTHPVGKASESDDRPKRTRRRR